MSTKRRSRWSAFTLLELMVTIVVISVLVSMAMVGYSGYRDRTAMLVDETNQKVILAAAKLYAYDNRFLPGNLSQLQPEHLERAYAMVTEGKQPYTLWAFLLEHAGLEEVAEAQTLLDPPTPINYLGANPLKVLTCPLDTTPPGLGQAGPRSYDMTQGANGAAGKPLSWLLDPLNGDRNVIIETDDGTTQALRHKRGTQGVAITTVGVLRRHGPNTGG